jgi:hypothetical protein
MERFTAIVVGFAALNPPYGLRSTHATVFFDIDPFIVCLFGP